VWPIPDLSGGTVVSHKTLGIARLWAKNQTWSRSANH